MGTDAAVDDLIEYADALYEYAHRGWWALDAQQRAEALSRIADLADRAAADLEAERRRVELDLAAAARPTG